MLRISSDRWSPARRLACCSSLGPRSHRQRGSGAGGPDQRRHPRPWLEVIAVPSVKRTAPAIRQLRSAVISLLPERALCVSHIVEITPGPRPGGLTRASVCGCVTGRWAAQALQRPRRRAGRATPGWRYPLACDVASGQVRYDSFGGRWGEPALTCCCKLCRRGNLKLAPGHSVAGNRWPTDRSSSSSDGRLNG